MGVGGSIVGVGVTVGGTWTKTLTTFTASTVLLKLPEVTLM
jgi:hypothetical protein